MESPIAYRTLGRAFWRMAHKDTSMVWQTMGFVLKELFAWPTEH
jgi:hypothetical protein